MQSRHPRRWAWTTLVAAAVLLAGPARAQNELLSRLVNPKVAYAADLTMTSGDTKIAGRIHHRPGLTRSEFDTQGQRTVTIINRARKRVWIVMASARQYMEMPLTGDLASAFLPPNATREQVKLTSLGKETVGGETTDKIRVEHPTGRAVMWVTGDGIMVRMDGVSTAGGRETKVTVRLRNVKRGPQDAGLFKVPAGYKKLAVPGRR